MQVEELAVSYPSQDPAFDDLYAGFHLGLVFGFAHPGGDYDRAVMVGHVQVGGIDVRFVITGFGNAGFQIVRNHDLRHAAQIGKGTDVGGNPVRKALGPGGFGIRIIGGAQNGYKYLSLPRPGGLTVIDRDGHAGVIDKEFLAGTVFLAHDRIDLFGPLPVPVTKLTVLIAGRVLRFMFLPEQGQGDPFAAQFVVDIKPVRQGSLNIGCKGCGRKKQLFQPGIIHCFGQWPA